MAARIWSIPDLPEGMPLPSRLESLAGGLYLEAGSILTASLKHALLLRDIPGFVEVASTEGNPTPHLYFQDPGLVPPTPVHELRKISLDAAHIQRLLRQTFPQQAPVQTAEVAAQSFLRHLYQQPHAPLDRLYLNQLTEEIIAWAETLPGPPVLLPPTGRPDNWIITHVLQSAQWAAWVGVGLGLPRILLTSMVGGALLRDVGQMSMPAEILFTATSLDAQGRENIAGHPLYSAAMLGALEIEDEELIRTVRQHHERFDGRGYPYQLPGPSLSEGAQILALTDTFAAVASPRPWRKACTMPEAVQALIQGAGAQFNPDLVRMFVQQIGPYPLGTILELDHRQTAIVTCGNPRRRWRPQVQLIERLNGSIELGPVLDLARSSAQISQVLR